MNYRLMFRNIMPVFPYQLKESIYSIYRQNYAFQELALSGMMKNKTAMAKVRKYNRLQGNLSYCKSNQNDSGD
jgi:hypothetical protein